MMTQEERGDYWHLRWRNLAKSNAKLKRDRDVLLEAIKDLVYFPSKGYLTAKEQKENIERAKKVIAQAESEE